MRRSNRFLFFLVLVAAVALFLLSKRIFDERKALSAIIARLSADSRIAEVLVTDAGAGRTTIKFVEYDASGTPLSPKYFSFRDNLIQFQSLVVRFDDMHVRAAHPLKGKSAYLFLKAFSLDGAPGEIYEINRAGEIPAGYRINGAVGFQERLWGEFWRYALSREAAGRAGIKNAQVEAPGTRFVPGILYTIRIEHDGGMRIDAAPLPGIVRGERIAG